MKRLIIILILLICVPVYGDIELTGKVAPKNDGFTGIVDASQVLGGGGSGVLPDACFDDVWINVDGGTLEIPNSTSLPASCNDGEIYMDTDATSGQQIYGCEGGAWVLQGDGGGGGGGDNITVNGSAADTTANFKDGDIDFTLVDGGAGGPDDVTATVDCSGCIDATDMGTDSVSADELNATGVEAELEGVMDLQDMQGAVTDGQVPNDITIDLSTLATNFTCTDNESTDENNTIVFVDGATGSQGAETDGDFYYNPSTGVVTATGFAGALTGNVTGNCSGSSGSCTGNAATATALATDGTDCNAGYAARGIDASGNAELCFDVCTQAEHDAEDECSEISGCLTTIDISENTNLTGGKYLTLTGDDLLLDEKIATVGHHITLEDPSTSDTAIVRLAWAYDVSVTKVSCSTDMGTATIQFDERGETTPNTSGTDILRAALVCDTDSQMTLDFSNTGIAAFSTASMDVDAVSDPAPNQVIIHVWVVKDD